MNENPYERLDKEAARVAYLIAGYIRSTLTEKEHDELDEWVEASDNNMKLFEELTDEQNVQANLAWMDKVNSMEHFEKLKEQGKFEKPVRRITAKLWLAAASIVLIAGAVLFYQSRHNRTAGKNGLAMNDSTILKPGGNRAILKLSDGKIIDLATAKNGLLFDGEGSHVSKLADGEIAYEEADPANGLFSIHTLSTPVGGQYQVKLPDGTKVWLNAATSISYPAQFASSSRSVELLGEAYFEVAKDPNRPFKVSMGGADVEVLGTHFNVMAYSNEKVKEVTLLEGSVKVSPDSTVTNQRSIVIKPGQQSVLIPNSPFTVYDNVDTSEITGWKDGQFVFHDTPIESIMRQIERWYGATVVYKGETKQLFNATIPRNEPLSKLLHLLELNGYVHFKTENKTIYVLP